MVPALNPVHLQETVLKVNVCVELRFAGKVQYAARKVAVFSIRKMLTTVVRAPLPVEMTLPFVLWEYV